MTNIIKSLKQIFKEDSITAHDAYMKAKYGRIETEESLLNQFFEKTEDLIKTRSQNGKYCAMAEVDTDILHHIDDIVNYYRKQGFQVLKITDKTTVNGEKLKNISSAYIILVWASCDIDKPQQNIEMVFESEV